MKQSRRRAKLTKGKVLRVISVLLVIALIAVYAVQYLRDKVESEYSSSDEDEVLHGTVTVGNISTTVYGSGRLSDDDEEKIEIPEGVELEKLFIQAGDVIEENALLATVDTNTVMEAMIGVNDEIARLDSEINIASVETVDNFLTSSLYGRIKAIFIEEGDSVADVMMEKGALMLLSLDGYMAVDIPAGELSEDDSVSVLTSMGYRYTGSVEKVVGDTATVLVTDDGTFYDDLVTVTDFQGLEYGSGRLYIHDPLRVIGYTGTAGYIYAKENKLVYSGTALLELVEQEYTVNLDALLVERRELEERLGELIRLYSRGALYAPFGGTVKEVSAYDDESREEAEESETNAAAAALEYISISPDKTMSVSVSVDESSILSVAVGQSAEVSINSLGDESFEGSVSEIDRIGTSSGGVTVYTATVSIPKESGMLAGMSASTTISIEGVDNALLIPVDALNKTSSSYFVYTSYDEESGSLGGMKEVTVGISNSDFVEIKTGLSKGDSVFYTEKEDRSPAYMPGGMYGSDSFGGGMPGGGRPGGMPGGMSGRRY